MRAFFGGCLFCDGHGKQKTAIIRGLENSLIQLCFSFLTVAVCWCLEPLPEEKIGLKADL